MGTQEAVIKPPTSGPLRLPAQILAAVQDVPQPLTALLILGQGLQRPSQAVAWLWARGHCRRTAAPAHPGSMQAPRSCLCPCGNSEPPNAGDAHRLAPLSSCKLSTQAPNPCMPLEDMERGKCRLGRYPLSVGERCCSHNRHGAWKIYADLAQQRLWRLCRAAHSQSGDAVEDDSHRSNRPAQPRHNARDRALCAKPGQDWVLCIAGAAGHSSTAWSSNAPGHACTIVMHGPWTTTTQVWHVQHGCWNRQSLGTQSGLKQPSIS